MIDAKSPIVIAAASSVLIDVSLDDSVRSRANYSSCGEHSKQPRASGASTVVDRWPHLQMDTRLNGLE
ncbi:hypothetical protein RB3634 [Rhodopirellula baltica SH 1]|uniref:Uncharacterized protein n=1 Tax=Rhodopirellula baltica (strain DSM 10527 / NCIMB 13988 / SH1) TaxID=243090 RepID=Q7UTX4_RHOBA|nr:hypothetical protein RB3634 [Rhodopirellula baltica SH 1]